MACSSKPSVSTRIWNLLRGRTGRDLFTPKGGGGGKGEKDGPEVALTDLIEQRDQGAEHFAIWLSGEIKDGNGNRSPAAAAVSAAKVSSGRGTLTWRAWPATWRSSSVTPLTLRERVSK